MLAADELDHDVDGGVAGDLTPIAGEPVLGDAELDGRSGVEGAGALDDEVDAVCFEVVVVVLADEANDAAAHRSKPDDADADGAV